ncbi:MAG: hypothetical protein Ct9H300mP23_01420 [Nitrospinota bacterium]|nr:MAG: hypothetical protein Ct9H300mP23_01420 [Nitrospinota bacterium]
MGVLRGEVFPEFLGGLTMVGHQLHRGITKVIAEPVPLECILTLGEFLREWGCRVEWVVKRSI